MSQNSQHGLGQVLGLILDSGLKKMSIELHPSWTFSACSKTCGGGIFHGSRKVLRKNTAYSYGRSCGSRQLVNRPCDNDPCPTNTKIAATTATTTIATTTPSTLQQPSCELKCDVIQGTYKKPFPGSVNMM